MTLWTILCLPVVFSVLVVMIEVSHLWQARVQLENALEAGAMAAVKQWGDQGGGGKHVAAARWAGSAYVKANTIHELPVDLENATLADVVHWRFGKAKDCGTGFHFEHCPGATSDLAVVLEASVKVARLCKPIVGRTFGEPKVTARVAAFYDCSTTPHGPQLIRIN